MGGTGVIDRFLESSPATSIPALACSAARSAFSRPRWPPSTSRWPACSGRGARRGRDRPPGQEDALYRRLRLHHRQLEQPRPDRLRELCRSRPEGRRNRAVRGRLPAPGTHRPGRHRCRPADPRLDLRPDGLRQLLRELHPDRGPAVRLADRAARFFILAIQLFVTPDRVQADDAGGLRPDSLRSVRQHRLRRRARARQRRLVGRQGPGARRHRRHRLDALRPVHRGNGGTQPTIDDAHGPGARGAGACWASASSGPASPTASSPAVRSSARARPSARGWPRAASWSRAPALAAGGASAAPAERRRRRRSSVRLRSVEEQRRRIAQAGCRVSSRRALSTAATSASPRRRQPEGQLRSGRRRPRGRRLEPGADATVERQRDRLGRAG